MNAVQLLTKDHDEVKAMFKQYEEAGKRAKKTRQKLVEQVMEELEMHTRLEEQVFYPAVREKGGEELGELVLEGIEEHGVAKFLMEQMRGAGPENETYDAKFKVLMESVEHHVKEEEKSMFPEVKKRMAEDLDRLGAEMEELRNQLRSGLQAQQGQQMS